MSFSVPCPKCTNEIPQPADCCPHCGDRPNLFWNVIRADDGSERAALEKRYDAAKADAATRGADLNLKDFETALAGSVAVIARPDTVIHRLVNNTRQLYGSYYQEIEAELRLPDDDEWSTVRELADSLLFTGFRQHIRFAALSLDGKGPSHFGPCSFALRETMIADRTSVLEENSVTFMERHNIKLSRSAEVPKGYRAPWASRARVCVAKLAAHIDSTTDTNEYSGLLLKQGSSAEDNEFVEVHIYGPITILTIARVTVTIPKKSQKATVVRALKSKLAKYGVSVS
jgi:hypothetical protein